MREEKCRGKRLPERLLEQQAKFKNVERIKSHFPQREFPGESPLARGSQQAAQTRFEPIRRDNHRVWARYQGRRLSACARLVQGFKVIAKQHTRTQVVRVFGPIPWDWPQELGAVAMV